MKRDRYRSAIIMLLPLLFALLSTEVMARESVKALYIPLADHYPGIIAYEKYRDQMRYADFSIQQMKSWRLLRSYFRSGRAELAFIISPMALDMFHERPDFRWVSLIHRDGNALAVNEVLASQMRLAASRADRKPDGQVAAAISKASSSEGKAVQIGVPSLLATHTVILYKYLKDHGLSMGLGRADTGQEVVAITVPPPRSPVFIKQQNSRSTAAAFEQSLPWADVVETGGYGKVAWYSKDVLPSSKGHVECIIIATDEAIRNKQKAIAEVIRYIQQAGSDLDYARDVEGAALDEMAHLIRKHIPAHNHQAILESLNRELDVIRYHDLDIDMDGMRAVMDLALEGGILDAPVDLNRFADPRFAAEHKVTHSRGKPQQSR